MQTETETETVAERIARLSLTDISDARLESLTIAHELVDDVTFSKIGNVMRCARGSTVIIPAHRLENLSRGRGWARKGKGSTVMWGERDDGGYRVGPGRWEVGATDGFSRKGKTSWVVEHVTVGPHTWTIAY